jgi:hypothetical protein
VWSHQQGNTLSREAVMQFITEGMVIKSFYAEGFVLKVTDRSIKVCWRNDNSIQEYTFAEVEKFDFTFEQA